MAPVVLGVRYPDPAVLDAFDTQFARVWDGKKATPDEQDPPIATPRELMPAKDVAGI